MAACDPSIALDLPETVWLRDFVRKCRLNGVMNGGITADQVSQAYNVSQTTGSTMNNAARDRRIQEVENGLNMLRNTLPMPPMGMPPGTLSETDRKFKEISESILRLTDVVTEQRNTIKEQAMVISELQSRLLKLNPNFGRF